MAHEVSFVDVIFEGYNCLVEVGETCPGVFLMCEKAAF